MRGIDHGVQLKQQQQQLMNSAILEFVSMQIFPKWMRKEKMRGCLEIRSMRNGEADAVPLCFVYPRSLPSHGRRGAPPAGDPKAGGEGTAGGRLNEDRRLHDTFLAAGPTVCVHYCVRPFNGFRRGC